MCFSPSASFLASAGLLGIGVATIRKSNRQGLPLAVIPFFFAIQQAIEGFQWLSLADGTAHIPLAYAYLFFAYLFWPVAIPAVVFAVDDKSRRRTLPLLCVGTSVALILLFLLFIRPVYVTEIAHSIAYSIREPAWLTVIGVATYTSVTVGAFILSSLPALRFFGWILLISLAIAVLSFAYAYASVWCFFSAALSALVYLIIQRHFARTS